MRFVVHGTLLLVAALALPAHADPAGVEFFEAKVRPILVDHCYACHGAETGKAKGGLLLDTRAGLLKGGESGKPAVVPGDADASLLVRAVRRVDPDTAMPPKERDRLSARQVADLVAWVNLGAPDPRAGGASASPTRVEDLGKDHWAFRRPADPPVPAVRQADWPRNDVDRFVLAGLEAAGLSPSPEADKRTLVRRLAYDLTGLPPTAEEVEAFAADSSPDAYEKRVDRLLASPRYGERWGRRWLDLARYSDAKGYVYDRDERFFVHAHHYRDWVIAALNADLPYDQFLLKQIAADQLLPAGASDNRDLAAMGFLTVGRRFLGVSHDIIDDRIDVVTRTALGLTVACARCHDHKFDPVPTADYYALYGVFMNAVERTVPIGPTPAAGEAYAAYQAESKKRTDKLEAEVRTRKTRLTDIRRKRVGEYLAAVLEVEKLPVELFAMELAETDLNPLVARRWDLYLRRLREPTRDPGGSAAGSRGAGSPAATHPIFAPWLALSAIPKDRFSSDAPAALSKLFADRAGEQNPRVAEAFAHAPPPASMADVAKVYAKLLGDADAAWRELVKQQPTATALPDPDREQLRLVLYGPDSPMNIPDGPVAETEMFFDEKSRVAMAKAQAEIDRLLISHPAAPPHAVVLADVPNPANARILKRGNPAARGEEVPRRFLGLFSRFDPGRPTFTQGSGRLEMAKAIVDPANPLTARVMVNRLWAGHFGAGLVPTPSDFGTRAEPPSHPELLDWLAVRFVREGWSLKRMHRLMVTSAAYRQASGDRPAARSADPENKLLWRQARSRLDFEAMRDALLAASGELDLAAGGRPVELFQPPFATRRAVYGKVDRQYLPGVLRAFDFANPDLHMPSRPSTTVPQQALFFMNNPFVVERARAIVRRPEVAAASSAEEKVRRLYRIVYQRDPTAAQAADAAAFVAAAGEPPTPEPPKVVPSAWRYGYAAFDVTTGKLGEFKPLPHFTGKAWQGGPAWPDEKLGWVQLTADGGHAGNDLAHAAVRRWVAPRDLTVSVSGHAGHDETAGDGVRSHVVSSRHGHLASWTLHNREAETKVEALEVKAGDTLDFVVDFRANLNSDVFAWAPVIREAAGGAAEWDARKEFAVPEKPAAPPLTAWEAYAQVLLLSNEFLFVD